MRISKSLLVTTLSAGLILSPIMAQAQDIQTVSTDPQQSTGGAAGNTANSSTGGMFGLSTMTLAGVGAALAAIVVVAVTVGKPADKIKPTCENGGIQDCFWPPTETTATSTSTTPASTSTSTGTGTGN